MKLFLMVAMNLHFYYYDCYKLWDTINLNWMNISFQSFFFNFYLIFPKCDKKDFQNFLILGMIVSFALTLLSRGSSLWLRLLKKGLFHIRAMVIGPKRLDFMNSQTCFCSCIFKECSLFSCIFKKCSLFSCVFKNAVAFNPVYSL